MLKSALLVTAGVIIGAGAISALHAQSNAPYYLVAEINVKDKTPYEASGVDKVRDGMKANGTGKLIAGGYNKAFAMDADSVANRVLIFQYPSKEAMDKDWKANIEPWEMRADVRSWPTSTPSASRASNRNSGHEQKLRSQTSNNLINEQQQSSRPRRRDFFVRWRALLLGAVSTTGSRSKTRMRRRRRARRRRIGGDRANSVVIPAPPSVSSSQAASGAGDIGGFPPTPLFARNENALHRPAARRLGADHDGAAVKGCVIAGLINGPFARSRDLFHRIGDGLPLQRPRQQWRYYGSSAYATDLSERPQHRCSVIGAMTPSGFVLR